MWCSEVQANAVAVRFLLLECVVLHFKCLSKRSLRNFVFLLESVGEHSSWNVHCLEAL